MAPTQEFRRYLETNAGNGPQMHDLISRSNPVGLRATAVAMVDEKKGQEMSLDSQQVEEVKSVTTSELRHKQVKELQAKGWSIKKIGRYLKMHRQTVRKYMQIEKVPKKRYSQGKRLLTDQQLSYLSKRWAEGDANAKQLWQELKAQGYQGATSSIYRAVAHFAPRATPIAEKQPVEWAIAPISARSAMWLMMKPQDKLSANKQKLLAALLLYHQQATIAYPLTQRFITMIKERQVEKLDGWIGDASESGVAQLKQLDPAINAV